MTKNYELLLKKDINNNKKLNSFYNHFYFGDFISLSDLIPIYSLVKKPLTNFILANNYKYANNNFNLGSSYSLSINFSELKKFNSFFFFGFNPRYESSLLNICFSRLREDNNSLFFSFNSCFSNFFPMNHQGAHIKNLLQLIEGRFSHLCFLRNWKKTKIIYGLEHLQLTYQGENIFSFLGDKFSTDSKLIVSDLTTLHYLELVGQFKSQNLYNNWYSLKLKPKKRSLSQKKTLIKSWFFNNQKIANKLTKFSKNLASTDFFELNLRQDQDSLKEVKNSGFKSFIPINFFYEQNTINLSIFGNLHKNDKVSTPEVSPIFSLFNWITFFYFFIQEKQFNFRRWWLYKFKKISGDHQNFVKLSYFYKKSLTKDFNIKNLINYFSLINIYNNNSSEILNTFSLNFSTKLYKSLIKFNFVRSNVLNFYLYNKLLNYSSTMTNLSYLYTNTLFLK